MYINQAILRAILETDLINVSENYPSQWIYLANGVWL